MTIAAEKIKAELAKLSDSERGELAHFLIQSLDQSEDENAETSWDHELARRADEIISGRSVAVPADNMFSELRAKYL